MILHPAGHPYVCPPSRQEEEDGFPEDLPARSTRRQQLADASKALLGSARKSAARASTAIKKAMAVGEVGEGRGGLTYPVGMQERRGVVASSDNCLST
jgi:hypothetical protein